MKKYVVIAIMLLSSLSLSQPTDTVKIMLLGHSYIEQDWGGGKKPYLWYFFNQLGYNKVKFIGRRNTGPSGAAYFGGGSSSSFLDFTWPTSAYYHEGITSKTAAAYATTGTGDVTTVLQANHPHVVSIDIGLNDVANGSYSAAQIVSNYGNMVRQIWAFDPYIRIVWLGMAKTQSGQSSWYSLIEAANALAVDSISKWSHSGWIKYVNVDSAMNETTDFYSDGHPSGSYGASRNSGGYYHLAQVEFPTLKEAVDYDGYPTPTAAKWVMGYITSWDLYVPGGASNYGNMPIDSLDGKSCSHFIFFSGGSPNDYGNIDSSTVWDGCKDIGTTNASGSNHTNRIYSLRNKVHENGRAVMFLHFIKPEDWAGPLSIPAYRTNFVNAVLTMNSRYGYDGMDFDLEPFSDSDTANAGLFFRELRDSIATGRYKQRLDPTKNLIVTSVVVGGDAITFWGRNQNCVDRVSYMNYDGWGDWWGVTCANNAVYSNFPTSDYQIGNTTNPITTMASIITSMANVGIPRTKIVFGVDFNGWAIAGGTYPDGNGTVGMRRVWTGSPATTYAPHKTQGADYQYYEMMEDFFLRCADSIQYDNFYKTPFIRLDYPGTSDTIVTFQDTSTMRYAMKLLADSSVGGAIIWDIPAGFIKRGNTNYATNTFNVPNKPYIARKDELLQAIKNGYRQYVGNVYVAPSEGGEEDPTPPPPSEKMFLPWRF